MCSRLFIFSFSWLIWVGCGSTPSPVGGSDEEGVKLTPLQKKGIDLQVAPLRRDSVWEEVRLVGRTVILAHAQAQLHSRVEGTIEAILLREGQYVQAGQEAFRVYSSTVIDLQRQYGEAYQRYKAALRRVAQQESLAVQQLSSATEVATARAELRQIQTQLRAIETQLALIGATADTTGRLRLISIVSPIAGYVTRVSTFLGEYVRPEKALAHIVNPSDLHADLYLSERELAWVKPGLPIRLSFPAMPEVGTLFSRIEYVAQVEDTTGTHLIAHVRVPPTAQVLFSGIPIEGHLRRAKGVAYCVPLGALGYHGRQAYLFAEKGGRYVPIPVQASRLDTLWLVEGEQLREGMPIVHRGGAFLAAHLWQVGEE